MKNNINDKLSAKQPGSLVARARSHWFTHVTIMIPNVNGATVSSRASEDMYLLRGMCVYTV